MLSKKKTKVLVNKCVSEVSEDNIMIKYYRTIKYLINR